MVMMIELEKMVINSGYGGFCLWVTGSIMIVDTVDT